MKRLLILVSFAFASAHYVWISPVSPEVKVGQPAKIQIGNGHEFPASESPLKPDNLKVFAVAPSGAKADIATETSGNMLVGEYSPKEKGLYRFVFVQDRGILSQTTTGYMPGGKDKYPDAKRSFKSYRSAVALAMTPGEKFQSIKPLGLAFEMTAERRQQNLVVTLLRDGKACSGADISAAWPGMKQQKLGQSEADGKFTYAVPAGARGPMLMVADLVENKTGGNYDADNHSTVLHLSW